MKTSRNFLALAVCALALVSIGAQAAGLDVHGFVLAHPDLFAGLSALALAGEVKALDPEEVKAALQKISDSVKETGEKALKEAEKAGVMSAETKASVDKLLTEQGELKSQLLEIEQKMAKKKDGEQDSETIGAQLEKSKEAIAEFVSARAMQKQINIPMSRKALVNSGATGAALNYPGQQIMALPLQPLLRRLTIRDLLAAGRTTSAVLFYPRETGFTNNAAPVSEGSLKPKSDLTFELITEPVRTIAHLSDISLQMLNDVAYIESYIETRMRYGLKLVEEGQLLMGSGTGQNLEGIYTAATLYAQPAGVEIDPTKEQDLDKLRIAMLQVELANAFTTGIVLHPTSWANIELLKDGENRYLFTNPQNTTTGRIWGRDVVSTPAMTAGRFLVGDFAQHAQIFDREDANVAISFENKDNFERNMATIRVEERLGLAIYRPEAFVKGTLESAS
ncbi:phage major capsid protein [Variovorax sp.]|jgi:HK97 family phage major capsid protein|uniref:phage major capsid protein n=1 Tax=Variovorax sp. TaxID=1871043 RepID=UPI00403802C4